MVRGRQSTPSTERVEQARHVKTVKIQISSAGDSGQDRRWGNLIVSQSLSTGSHVGQLSSDSWLNVQSAHSKY